MIFIIIVLIIFCCSYSPMYFYEREIKNITIQLNEYNNLKSLKKIDATLFDKEIENLAYSINKHIDINIQSQIKQKRLEEEIRKNIANISHDLRTPLTSSIGYIQMIKKGIYQRKSKWNIYI